MWIKDYMCEWVNTISPEKTIADAVKEMVEKKTNGMIVTDEDDKPIGIISSRSLIKEVVPEYLGEDPSHSKYGAEGTFERYANAAKDVKIKDTMITDFHILNENDTMIEAAAYAGVDKIRILPVVNSEGKLIGVLTRTCIKIALYNAIFNTSKVDPYYFIESKKKHTG
jgi:predicted transcriptional regulator